MSFVVTGSTQLINKWPYVREPGAFQYP